MTGSVSKGPEAFRTISEASVELGVPSHVLRFWETKFSFIRPMKRAGGRRFYRPRDLSVLKGVRALLHEEGYTIKGVQRLHKEEGLQRLLAAAGAAPGEAEAIALVVQSDEAAPIDETASVADEDASILPLHDEEPRRPVVEAIARARLVVVLEDLTRAKAAVDRLLRSSPES